jgi:5'-nucleotidase
MIILLDVDGVLADFHGGILSLIQDLFNLHLTINDFKNWDYTSALKSEKQKQILREQVKQPGLISRLSPYSEAVEAVGKLRRLGEVICLTSPNHSVPTWIPERYEWLERHFKIPPQDVTLTGKKHLVDGDIMIDDHPDNVLSWIERHPAGAGFMWDRPYTKNNRAPRIDNWNEIILACSKN